MVAPPLPASLHVSDFYERQRRLAYHFSWLAMTLLLVELSTGFVLELFGLPRAAATEDGVALFYRCLSREETDSSRFLQLDASMKPREEPLRLVDNAGAVVLDGRDVAVFYGPRISVLSGGKNARSVDLGQTWDVLAALRDPGQDALWIFGWNEGKIVARRRDRGAWGAEIAVSSSGQVDRLSASIEGTSGPLVAWRELGSTRIRTALYDGQGFIPRPEFEIGESPYWDVVLAQGRNVLAFHHRDDRGLDSITLRIECCPGCASPLPPHKVQFADPVLLFGRKITGLALLQTGDRLRFFLTRPSRIVWTSVPAASVESDPTSKLQILEVHSLLRNLLGSIIPTSLFFCSAALVFIGFTLLRERSRAVRTPPQPAPAEADLPSRSMAYLLDLILLSPVVVAVVGYLDLPVDDLSDPRFLWLILVGAGVEFAYHFLMEWGFGWTVGKRVMGIRVTELDAGRLGCRGALLRNLIRVIDGTLPFGWLLGIGAMLRTTRRQRLGDIVARTLVLRDQGSR
jgi:uncharacterized RDD family membrane protein YckC